MQRLMEEHDHLFPDNHIDIRKWRNESHDRWLIIDDSLYHCGHSLNANGGHKISAITLMGTTPDVILSKVEQQLSLPAVPSRITNCFSKSSPCGFIPAKTILARALMPPLSARLSARRSHPAQKTGEGSDAPPTLQRSGYIPCPFGKGEGLGVG